MAFSGAGPQQNTPDSNTHPQSRSHHFYQRQSLQREKTKEHTLWAAPPGVQTKYYRCSSISQRLVGTNRALCSHVHVAADHRSIIISTWVTCDDPLHKVWLIPGQLTKIVSNCDMVLPLLVSQKTPNTGDTGADDNWATLKTCSQKFLPAPVCSISPEQYAPEE